MGTRFVIQCAYDSIVDCRKVSTKRAPDPFHLADLQALRKSEQRFRAIVDQAILGIAQTDLNGRFTLVSQRYCEITGYSDHELLRMRMQDITHPDDLPRSIEMFERLAQGGPDYVTEKRYLRKDGSVVWVSNSVGLVHDVDGAVQGVLAVCSDVTGRRLAESRNQFLLHLEDELRPLAHPEDITAASARLLGQYLGVDRCAYTEIDDDEDHFTITGDYSRGVQSIVGRFSMAQFGAEALRQMRANETYVVSDTDLDERITMQDLAAYRHAEIRAVICVPLHKAGRFVASMAVHQKTPRHWTRDEIELVRNVTSRCWESIERARAWRELHESEQRLQMAVELTRLGTWRQDLATGEIICSDQCKANFGLAPDARFSYDELMQAIHPEDIAVVRQKVAQAIENKVQYDAEYRMYWPDGSLHWISAHGRVAYDANGKPVQMTGVTADITDHKQAQGRIASLNDDLHRHVEELETLLRTLPVGIFIAQDAACTNITMNPAGATMLRIPEGSNSSKTGPEAERLPFRVFKNGAEVAGKDLPMQRAARLGAPVVSEEVDVVFPDGNAVSLYEYASPLFDEAGRVRGCLGVFIDLTDRKRAEKALKDADRRKDEFLATLAHELRNPLAPIRNGLHFLRLQGHEGEAADRIHDMMERQVSHMVRLVDDLLEVSRITRGKIELRKERVDLADVVRSAIETARPLVEVGRHRLEIDLPTDPLEVEADPIRLAQVFANLLNNAAKYTEEKGRIWLNAHQQGNDAVISVRDNGVGIRSDLLPQVFEMFTQVDRATGRAQGGLGIGLALVRSLVELHGGHVEARSEGLGKGSEFVVQIPLAVNHSADAALAQEQTSARLSPLRILVVDDNRDAADSLGMLLEALGAEACVVYDGPTALQAFQSSRPAALLLDIGMPGMDGYEVARRIRKQSRDVTLIALTGWGQEEDHRRSRAAGCDYHLTKPADIDALQTLLESLASRENERRTC